MSSQSMSRAWPMSIVPTTTSMGLMA
jgi:hypothetical protein